MKFQTLSIAIVSLFFVSSVWASVPSISMQGAPPAALSQWSERAFSRPISFPFNFPPSLTVDKKSFSSQADAQAWLKSFVTSLGFSLVDAPGSFRVVIPHTPSETLPDRASIDSQPDPLFTVPVRMVRAGVCPDLPDPVECHQITNHDLLLLGPNLEVLESISQILSVPPDFTSHLFTVTIIETYLTDSEQFGTDIFTSGSFKDLIVGFANDLTSPASIRLNSGDSSAFADYVISNSKIMSKPQLYIMSGGTGSIVVGDNIPLISSVEYDDETNTKTTSYERTDIGISLSISPEYMRITDTFILSFDSSADSIKEGSDLLTSIISRRNLNSQFVLKRSQPLYLGGIIKEITSSYRSGVPFLKDIPLLKYIFGRDAKKTENVLLSFVLSVGE